ncbi:unnamed protein product [Pedinophyceae sp. YPF-701]|nr:unnamed protein product [Pedinophyceae sp. YPF-701]
MSVLDWYIKEIVGAVARKDGNTAAAKLRVHDAENRQVVAEAVRSLGPRLQLSSAVGRHARVIPESASEWERIIVGVLDTMRLLDARKAEEAYDALSAATAPVIDAFKAADGGWITNTVRVMARNLRHAAEEADKQLTDAGKRAKCLGRVMEDLRKYIRPINVSGDIEKKAAVLSIYNQMIKVAFDLSQVNMAFQHVQAASVVVAPKGGSAPAYIPLSDLVVHKYYEGRLHMFNDDYAAARAALEFALEHTPVADTRRRSLVLKYLIPVNMLRGHMPTEDALRACGMDAYVGVLRAVTTGDIGLFNRAVDEHVALFTRDGTLFVIDRLKAIAYRQLLRRVHAFNVAKLPADATANLKARVPLPLFAAALAACGEGSDLDEVECVVANLIAERKVVGAINHGHRILSLSQKEPFPSLG